MNAQKNLDKSTLLFILIFLIGITYFIIYINNTFNEEANGTHTNTEQVDKRDSQKS